MPALPVAQPRSPSSALERTRQFESATAEVLARDYPVVERGVLFTLAGLIVFIFVFISIFKIERIVSAPGRLMPITGTITVQPMDKAIIRRVMVGVGDVVEKGQILATCDPTFAAADLTQLQQKIASLDAQLRRMQAEAAGQPLPAASANSYDLLQASIFQQRRTEFNAGVSDFDQRINSTEAQVEGLRQKIRDDQSRLGIATKMEGMNAELA